MITTTGSHGQTVWHDVDPTTKKVTSTLQLGEPAVITELTGRVLVLFFPYSFFVFFFLLKFVFLISGITCVADFRVADVAAGGQVDQSHLKEMIIYLNSNSTIRKIILWLGCSVDFDL
jgi:hypothetical protein